VSVRRAATTPSVSHPWPGARGRRVTARGGGAAAGERCGCGCATTTCARPWRRHWRAAKV